MIQYPFKYTLALIRDELKTLVEGAVARLIEGGKLPEAVREVPVEISDTKQPEHGDYACNFALAASKKAGMPPRTVGDLLASSVGAPADAAHVFQAVEVAGPGFINFRLQPAWVASFVGEVLERGTAFARPEPKEPKRINVEFVSVNPNGPITVGSGRGAAFGSTLCNVLEAAGHTVHREYYINDGVNSEQMRQFARSIQAFFEDIYTLTPPDQDLKYRGEYVKEAASEIALSATTFPERLLRVVCRVNFDVDAEPHDLIGLTKKLAELSVNFGYELDDQIAEFKRPQELAEAAAEILVKVKPQSPTRRHVVLSRANLLRALFIHLHRVLKQEGPTYDLTERDLKEEGRKAWENVWSDYIQNRRSELLADSPEFNPKDKFFNKGSLDVATSFAASNAPEWEKGESIASALSDSQTSESFFQALGKFQMLRQQAEALQLFGVEFDTWFSEQSLHDRGDVAKGIEEMLAKGAADEEPYRTKLKLGKNGKVEAVEREEQPVDDEDDDVNSLTPDVASSTTSTLWLRSTKFGDDMDRVLRRKDGRLTYIASDVAYHRDKFNRPANADKLITILGPDHHGYIGRLQAVLAALLEEASGVRREASGELSENEAMIYRSPEERDACLAALEEARRKLEVVIFQIVRFVKDGKPAPMRKRDGNIYELRDLINEIGKNVAPNADAEEQRRIGADVSRFFYLMRSHDTHMDFDIDLATKGNDENPVFYAQYAHARIASVIRKAEEGGVRSEALGAKGLELLVHPRETALIKKIADLPMEVGRCAEDYGVHRLTTYAVELGRTFHHFYDACRVVQPDQPELTQARLALCEAAKTALKATFDLLGVSAPERMER